MRANIISGIWTRRMFRNQDGVLYLNLLITPLLISFKLAF